MSISTHHQVRGFQTELAYVNRIIDATLIWLILYLLRHIFQIEASNQQLYVLPALLAIIVYFLAAELFSLFSPFRLTTLGEMTKRIFTIWLIVAACLILIALASKTSTDYSRLAIGWWLVLCPFAITISHVILDTLLRHFSGQKQHLQTYAILGEGQSIHTLPEKIARDPWIRFRLVGAYNQLSELLDTIKTNPLITFFFAMAVMSKKK